uniref:NADH dehydrogenase subunit 4L n=1 Tax=Bregmatothrips sinensis TaxID=3045418 RepID=UPI0030E1B961
MISCFFFLIYVYFSNFGSFLSSLLILESISLVLYFFLVYFFFVVFSLKFCMYYFVFLVCESAIGLSILVKCIKFFGSTSFFSMNLSKF